MGVFNLILMHDVTVNMSENEKYHDYCMYVCATAVWVSVFLCTRTNERVCVCSFVPATNLVYNSSVAYVFVRPSRGKEKEMQIRNSN